jgi:hypothetical protein
MRHGTDREIDLLNVDAQVCLEFVNRLRCLIRQRPIQDSFGLRNKLYVGFHVYRPKYVGVAEHSVLFRTQSLLVSTPGAWSGVGVPLTRKLDGADTKTSEEAVTFGRESEYLPCQQSLESFMERSLIDISALDVQVQEQVAKYGNVKDFHVVLWRQDPDTAGCNWNARIERIRGGSSSDLSWWDVVPQMRERFNLN